MRWKVVMALMVLGFMGILGSPKGWADCCSTTDKPDEYFSGQFYIPCPNPADGWCSGSYDRTDAESPLCVVTLLDCLDREQVELECAGLGVAGPCGPVRTGYFRRFEFAEECRCATYVYDVVDKAVNFKPCACCGWCEGGSQGQGGKVESLQGFHKRTMGWFLPMFGEFLCLANNGKQGG